MTLNGVSKKYGETVALNNVSVNFEEGKITAILGESGAGKSTLFHAIAGLTSYEGEIDGERYHKSKRGEYSYLFQEAKLLPNLTAEENLRFALPKSEWEKIPAMFERVGLKGKERSFPKQLSGGEKQRVAVARAFLYPHRTLLMDEPFSSLDLALKKSLIELVTQLWQERGSTVLFITHDVREAILLGSRAVVLKKGEIVADLPVPQAYPRDFFEKVPQEEALIRALMG